MKRFAVYARKSKKRGDDVSASIELQLDHCRNTVAQRDGAVVLEAFDDGVSGALFDDRPGLQEVIRAAERREIDAVIFYSLDRFGRNAKRSFEALLRFGRWNVEVHDTEKPEPANLNDLASFVTWAIGGFNSAEHAKATRRKTRDGMRRDAAAGKWLLPAPYGYEKPVTKRNRLGHSVGYELVIVPHEAEVILDIATRFANGEGLHSIVRRLNESNVPHRRGQHRRGRWSTNVVRSLLVSETYRGRLVYGKSKIYWDGDPEAGSKEKVQLPATEAPIVVEKPRWTIIDATLALRIDEQIAARQRRTVSQRTAHGRHLLSGGAIRCRCGANFGASTQRGVYSCSRRKREPGTCDFDLAIPIQEFDRVVIEAVEEGFPDFWKAVTARPIDARKDLQKQLKEVEQKISRLVASIMHGVPAATVAPMIQKLETVKATAERRMAAAPPKRGRGDMEDALRRLKSGDLSTARAEVKRLLGPIVLDCQLPAHLVEWSAPLQLVESRRRADQKEWRIGGQIAA